jgi:hypothetical protein
MNYFLLKEYVDSQFDNNTEINHELISANFRDDVLMNLSNDEFIEQLIILGYIPDLYLSDSSQETLYTKLTEVVVSEWARRMGYESKYVKQKSSYEDVDIIIPEGTIVCDAKSFRMGRSQKSPNVKDFVKPEDYKKWLSRHECGIGGLVAYPCLHEWTGKSDAFKYCSSKNNPIVMLPYKYLAYILKYNNGSLDISKLWEYESIFDNSVNNSVDYWKKMNEVIINITSTSEQVLNTFLKNANDLIREYTLYNIDYLLEAKDNLLALIEREIQSINNLEEIKKLFTQYKVLKETDSLEKVIKRIKAFRL